MTSVIGISSTLVFGAIICTCKTLVTGFLCTATASQKPYYLSPQEAAHYSNTNDRPSHPLKPQSYFDFTCLITNLTLNMQPCPPYGTRLCFLNTTRVSPNAAKCTGLRTPTKDHYIAFISFRNYSRTRQVYEAVMQQGAMPDAAMTSL